MEKEKSKVLLSGMEQPVKFSMDHLNAQAVDVIKNSKLYKGACTNQLHAAKKGECLKLQNSVSNNGWDTVSICRVTALNERIKSDQTYPENIQEMQNPFTLEGKFAAWQVVTGGDGRNVKLNVPMASGTYVGLNNEKFDLSGISVDIYVTLSYFPLPKEKVEDGHYKLYVQSVQQDQANPIASVIALKDPNKKLDSINKSILRGLFESWLNKKENLEKFNTLFATILINNMGKESEEYKWLRATTISYAYTDSGSEETSIFGILCMTNDRSADGLPRQLPAIALEKDDNAIFTISREVFVKYQFKPALPFIFPESPKAVYDIDSSGTVVNCKGINLDKVRVGAIDYEPVAEQFEVSFDENYIQTTANIKTNISPGIDVRTEIRTKQVLVLGKNSKGEDVMLYQNVGEPYVKNTNEISPWIEVTEIILGLIAAVVTGIAGAVAGKIAALVVGIIVAAVVALIGGIIHGIIVAAVGGSVADEIPSVGPMVKVATNQIQWPFCEENAFTLTNIEYSGCIILDGILKIAEQYQMKNNRLVYVG